MRTQGGMLLQRRGPIPLQIGNWSGHAPPDLAQRVRQRPHVGPDVMREAE